MPSDAVLPDAGVDDAGEVSGRPSVAREVKGATVTIAWKPLRTIKNFPMDLPAAAGIYIVCDASGRPLYVGETDNLATRWHNRLRDAHQVGLIEKLLRDPVRIWLGTLPRVSGETRRTVEEAILRTLYNGGLGDQLRNVRSVNEFRTLGPLQITNVLPSTLAQKLTTKTDAEPAVLRAIQQIRDKTRLSLPPQTVFEVGFYAESSLAPPSALSKAAP